MLPHPLPFLLVFLQVPQMLQCKPAVPQRVLLWYARQFKPLAAFQREFPLGLTAHSRILMWEYVPLNRSR